MKIKNRIVVITGAAGGFGHLFVERFLKQNCMVYALDLNAKGLEDLTQKFKTSQLKTYVLDVSSPKDFKNFKNHLELTQHTPQIWINNAGIARPDKFSSQTLKTFKKVIDINLNGVVYGTKCALKIMKEGTIVNMSSASGHIPSPYLVSYSTAKHGVVGFTRGLQLELQYEKNPINLMLVSPGFAKTEIMNSNPDFFKVPASLNWLVSTPDAVVNSVISGLKNDKKEIHPCLSAKTLIQLFTYGPRFLYDSTSHLLTHLAKPNQDIKNLEKPSQEDSSL